jgi:orotate phosphoribosyltransferase
MKEGSMDQNPFIDAFKKSEALLTGHFKLTSGFHSNQYLQCAKVLQYPEFAMLFGAELIKRIPVKDQVTCVIGPAIGGITFAYEVGRQLGKKTFFGERENGVMTFRRGFKVTPTDKVLVVEDVITTGGSVKEIVDLVKQNGAQVVAIGSIVDRSNGKADFGGIPYYSLLSLDVIKYDPNDCPLCKQGVPLYQPGSRYISK